MRLNPKLKPWIRWLYNEEATGLLKKEYDTALQRAGKIWNIERMMSLNPAALQASMRLYGFIVHRATPKLGRPEGEMIAVVISQTNHCHY
jgi:alkylhydroperoxidase family enzyme